MLLERILITRNCRRYRAHSRCADITPPSASVLTPTLDGKQPLWGQNMNANFVKPGAIKLELVTEGERFG
jgi:hypothetical protein